MYSPETLARLQQTWPETTDYLQRVGQVNNDLMVMREMQSEQPEGWMDRLGVEERDLLELPTGLVALQFLNAQGITVSAAMRLPELQELATDQQEMFEAGETAYENFLEDPTTVLPSEALELRVWALPELQKKLIEWANATATTVGAQVPPMTLTQAAILLWVHRFVDQSADRVYGQEYLRSALSSEFFKKAASLAA